MKSTRMFKVVDITCFREKFDPSVAGTGENNWFIHDGQCLAGI
jgi:hypothetical protein